MSHYSTEEESEETFQGDDHELNLDEVDRICCIGAGRMGILSMAALSTHWPDKTFVVVDANADIIGDQIPRQLHFWEPNVDWLLDLAMYINQNLIFSPDVDAELDHSRVIFLAVDIPLRTQPKQVKNDFEVENLEAAIVSILNSIDRAPQPQTKFIAVKSTLPFDYNNDIRGRFSRHHRSRLLHITTNPEFFSEGTAVDDLLNPPKIVLGNFLQNGQHIFRDLYLPVVNNEHDRIEMINTLSSSELGKLLSNAAIASQLTIMNIGSTICERVNCSFDDGKRSYMANPRLSPFFVNSRAGYGGPGLTKDISYLAFVCENAGLKKEMDFFKKLIQMRKKKMDDLVNTILSNVGSSQKIAIYGFANKVNTDDIRDSPSIYVCNALLRAHNVELVIYDPLVPDPIITNSFPDRVKPRVSVAVGPEPAMVNAHALVFLLEWPQFRALLDQHVQVMAAMSTPRIIFDCCDLLSNAADLVAAYEGALPGTRVYRLGNVFRV